MTGSQWTEVHPRSFPQPEKHKAQPPWPGLPNAREYLSSEILRILALVLLPLFGQIVGGKDRRNWANRDAGAAVNTLDGIDEQHVAFSMRSFIFLRMDAIYRAGVDASRVLRTNAGFCDYVCH